MNRSIYVKVILMIVWLLYNVVSVCTGNHQMKSFHLE